MEYLPKDALVIIDESHATLPQLAGMYRETGPARKRW